MKTEHPYSKAKKAIMKNVKVNAITKRQKTDKMFKGSKKGSKGAKKMAKGEGLEY